MARWPSPSNSPVETLPSAIASTSLASSIWATARSIGRIEIDDHHRDGAIALGPGLEAALELERSAEQDGERRRLAEHARDGLGIAMAIEDRIDRRAQPNDAAAHVEVGHGGG